MNEGLNLHWRERPRWTVAKRRRVLGWALKGVCVGLLGLLGYLLWR